MKWAEILNFANGMREAPDVPDGRKIRLRHDPLARRKKYFFLNFI